MPHSQDSAFRIFTMFVGLFILFAGAKCSNPLQAFSAIVTGARQHPLVTAKLSITPRLAFSSWQPATPSSAYAAASRLTAVKSHRTAMVIAGFGGAACLAGLWSGRHFVTPRTSVNAAASEGTPYFRQRPTRTCRRCHQQFDPAVNRPESCRYHPGPWTGAEASKFYGTQSGGPHTGLVRFWECCDGVSPESLGCTQGPHVSYDG